MFQIFPMFLDFAVNAMKVMKTKKQVKYFEGFLQNGRGSWSGLNNQVPYSKQRPQQIYALGILMPFMQSFTAQVLLEDVRS